MKTITARAPRARSSQQKAAPAQAIADLIGPVEGLPQDLGARKKRYLRATAYGRKRPR